MIDILWLARSIPLPANSGDKIYTGKLVSRVADAGARVTFVGLADQKFDWAEGDLSQNVSWTVAPGNPRSTLRSLVDFKPMVAARYGTIQYRKLVRSLLARNHPDVVILDQYGLVFALAELQAAQYRGTIVHIAHDFETMVSRDVATSYAGNKLRKLALTLNSSKTARAERELAFASDLVATLTDFDAHAFRRIGARQTVTVPPGYDGPIAEAKWRVHERRRRVAIIGSFEWTAKQLNLSNFLAAADALFAAAGIGIDVVGNAPTDFCSLWESKLRSARFHGFVKDLTPIFRHSRFGLIIEKTGGGFKLKSLDYIFNGLPVGALSGSFEGIPQNISRHFLIEDSAQALAKSVIAAIEDDVRLSAMQAGALGAARGTFDWDTSARKLLDAIRKVRLEGPRDVRENARGGSNHGFI
jgi:polysaccharide biosynthesis protein PslH